MAPTAVVIPTFNRCSTLLYCLAKLFETLPPTYVVIVVDSGSSDGTRDAVRSAFPQAILIEGNPSMWWAAATNRGVQRAKELGCSYVLTYNDDNVATDELFTNLSRASDKVPDGIVGAVCCYANHPEIVFFAGRMRATGTDRLYYLNHDEPISSLGSGLRRVDMLHGMCTLIPMAAFSDIGLFNAMAFPQVFADDDFFMRARRKDTVLYVALDAIVLNDRSKTGFNPYDRRLGPWGIFQLLFSRKSSFQISARTRFLWWHRRGFFYFVKTWVFDYLRLFTILLARWLLPIKAFHWLGAYWGQRLQRRCES